MRNGAVATRISNLRSAMGPSRRLHVQKISTRESLGAFTAGSRQIDLASGIFSSSHLRSLELKREAGQAAKVQSALCNSATAQRDAFLDRQPAKIITLFPKDAKIITLFPKDAVRGTVGARALQDPQLAQVELANTALLLHTAHADAAQHLMNGTRHNRSISNRQRDGPLFNNMQSSDDVATTGGVLRHLASSVESANRLCLRLTGCTACMRSMCSC